jgi:isoleucyl-tRNA synthetase
LARASPCRARAASFAKETVERQCKSFRRYGVWGDWDEPYLTLQPEYEAAQIRVFGDMVLKGHVYRCVARSCAAFKAWRLLVM